ncbi:MAG: hypothetical protein AAFS12_02290, partial [Cyanobacteria bacterium J06632_19]
IVVLLQNAIEEAAYDKPEMPVFVARLFRDNIQVNCKFTRTGKLKGISYCIDGEAFKGGDLGKLYTHIGIRKHLEVGYQQHYSNPISSLIESYKRGYTIDDEWVKRLEDWCVWRNEELNINNNNRNSELDINNNRNEKLNINNNRNEELNINNKCNSELDINNNNRNEKLNINNKCNSELDINNNNRNEELDINNNHNEKLNINNNNHNEELDINNNRNKELNINNKCNSELDINNNNNDEDKTTNISISSAYVNGNNEEANEEKQPEVIKPVPFSVDKEQHIVPSEETPLTSEFYSFEGESNSQTQPSEETPSFGQEEEYIIPTNKLPLIRDDIYPEIITDTTNYLDIKVEPTDTVTQSQSQVEIRSDVTQEQEQFQEQCVRKIANTVLLIWQQYSLNSESIRGKNYDIEFGSEDIILVKRKSGETIAEIPFDVSKQPRGIALTEEDISNWNATQRQIEAHLERQPASRTKRKVVKDNELD